jgi:hypothetical protein
MRTHAAAEEVQQRGLLALFQFVAPNSDNAARAEAAGAMRAIAHALSMPAHVAELRANTQAAMLLVQLPRAHSGASAGSCGDPVARFAHMR